MKSINELINNDVLKGRKIFPCKSNGKRPLTLHGHKDASSDVGFIKTWWSNCYSLIKITSKRKSLCWGIAH